ncbi:MAG: sialidase family protein [Planctomycetota bacterium]
MLIRGEGRRRDWVGRGRLVDLQNGTWAYIYVRGDHHSSVIDRHKQIHIRFSTDQGDSWTDANTLPDGGKVDGFPIQPKKNEGLSEVEFIRCPNGDLLCLYRVNAATPQQLKDRQVIRLGQFQKRSRDGGRTWVQEPIVMGRTWMKSALDFCTIGNTIHMGFLTGQYDGTVKRVLLVSSPDGGKSWTETSELAGEGSGVGETGLLGIDENGIVAVCRTKSEKKTMMRLSDDAGKSWGAWIDITSFVGVVQQPRLRRYSSQPDRIYLLGRNRYQETVQRNGIWWSDNGGKSWQGFDLDEIDFKDTGYGDALMRDDGRLVYLAYRGRDGRCDLIQYVLDVSE